MFREKVRRFLFPRELGSALSRRRPRLIHIYLLIQILRSTWTSTYIGQRYTNRMACSRTADLVPMIVIFTDPPLPDVPRKVQPCTS